MNLIFKDQHLLYLNNTHQKHFKVMGFWGFGVMNAKKPVIIISKLILGENGRSLVPKFAPSRYQKKETEQKESL